MENTREIGATAGRGARRSPRSAETSKSIAGRRTIQKNALDGVWGSSGSIHRPASPRPNDPRDVPRLPEGSHHRRLEDGLDDTGAAVSACTLRARLTSRDDHPRTTTMAETSATFLGHKRQQLGDRHSRHMEKVQTRGY